TTPRPANTRRRRPALTAGNESVSIESPNVSRQTVALRRFPEAVDGRNGQRVRQPGHLARRADGRHPDPACGSVPGGAAVRARVSRLPDVGFGGWGLCRPTAASADPD